MPCPRSRAVRRGDQLSAVAPAAAAAAVAAVAEQKARAAELVLE